MHQKHSKKNLTKTLNWIPCAETRRPKVDELIKQTVDFLSKNMNSQLDLSSYQSRDNLTFVLKWKGNYRCRPGQKSIKIVAEWQLQNRWRRTYRKNVSLDNITQFLNSLCQCVMKYKGRHNPIKRI